jgi:hypothetical protein
MTSNTAKCDSSQPEAETAVPPYFTPRRWGLIDSRRHGWTPANRRYAKNRRQPLDRPRNLSVPGPYDSLFKRR